MHLKGKTAIVTGSTQGLGYAIAAGLAESGCNVMLSGFGPAAEIERQLHFLEDKFGVKAAHNGADFTRPDEIIALVEDAKSQFGGVDILVNNAVYRHHSPVEGFPKAEWDTALAVNVSAPFHLIKHCLPLMRQAGWGRIINIGSIRSYLAVPNRVDYVTSKHALIGMTKAIAQEVLRDDITCNVICPGSLKTPNSEKGIAKIAAARGFSAQEAEIEYLKPREPRGRFNALENIAGLVLFLCSQAGRDINGTAIPVDGGRHGAELTD